MFSGIPLHFDNLWQIIMNDAGSLVCWCAPALRGSVQFMLRAALPQPSHAARFWDILLLVAQSQSTDSFIAHVSAWVASGMLPCT